MTFDIATGMSLADALNLVGGASIVPMEKQLSEGSGGLENYRSPLLLNLLKQGMHEKVLQKDLAVNGIVTEQQMIMQVFGNGEDYHKLRAEKVQLSIHHLGNTVLQHLFRLASPEERLAILNGIAPYLAYVGIHHRGTWVAQTPVDSCRTEEEQRIIAESFREWAPALMCDKIGNYLCPGIVEYGPELNNFLFEAAMDRLLVIASDRYGARCLLKCLESSKATLYQKQKLVATSIVLNSIPFATSSNGALLLTWLLDASNLPGRYDLISKRFLPHLSHLCNHRIASCSISRKYHVLLDSIGRTNSRLTVMDIQARRILSRPSSFTKVHPLPPAKLSLRQTSSQFLPSFQFISSEIKGSGHPYHPYLPCRPQSFQSFGQGKVVTSQAHAPKEPRYSMPLQAFPTPEFRPVQAFRPTTVIPPSKIMPENVPLPVTPTEKTEAEVNKCLLVLKDCLASINGC
ncbi:hypothetical protein I305_01386 [Cryptococcus gattii E566]|uniref:RNA binding protein of the PUF protein family, putative Puf2p n=1 Tax=Cryptococcus gattii serotype B (strain WM276 / ATCC MYA-4071) TaxID=367775 RepID=E6R9C0_CRYGW|nr:RNA binding protein of the PUF protein family, putative; Puf2p [Cryptococcus gattii WM276]ADV23398.1 RNA binding protein of the PUF protein family, putative; Puf2p [Cryptococcus gattii WM276]KIY35812.1 hypothetical protein I305_01386 [Cryptococcus gattii E566]